MERETGIEPATNSLGSCDSTTELLPLKSGRLVEFTTAAKLRAILRAPRASRTSRPTLHFD